MFGVTHDPFIVYSSNIFAILSLRALYGFVSTVMSELRFLDKAVALVLGFIGWGGNDLVPAVLPDDGLAWLGCHDSKPPWLEAMLKPGCGLARRAKMVLDFFDFTISTGTSLGIVAATLGMGVAASLLVPGPTEEAE